MLPTHLLHLTSIFHMPSQSTFSPDSMHMQPSRMSCHHVGVVSTSIGLT